MAEKCKKNCLKGENQLTVLKDVKQDGQARPWREKKMQSLSLSAAYHDIALHDIMRWGKFDRNEAEGILQSYIEEPGESWLSALSRKTDGCADHLEFKRADDGSLKLYRAWFCKDRLCPMCNWRRSLKYTAQIAKILAEMQRQGLKARPIFLTLTMKNVSAGQIGQSLSEFAASFSRLMAYRAVKTYAVGAIRSSEVTYNSAEDTWNTHIHCLVWMKPAYFSKGGYLSQAKWTELWKKAARLDYTPIVHVKAVKKREPTEGDPSGMFAAVLEVAKYPVKPESFSHLLMKRWDADLVTEFARLERIRKLREGLHRKRLISFFGIIKEIHKKLNLEDPEDGDLTDVDTESEKAVSDEIVVAYWNAEKHDYCIKDGGKKL